MPVVVVSSAFTNGTVTCAGPFSSAAGMGFTGTRGDGFTETDLWEGVKTCGCCCRALNAIFLMLR